MKLEEKAKRKREELENIIKSFFSHSNIANINEISRKIIKAFTIITPPEEKQEERRIEFSGFSEILFINNHWSQGARSIKPGNILLNWERLLIYGAESILSIAGVVNYPWLIPLAGLVVWNKIWPMLNIKINERHAVVI